MVMGRPPLVALLVSWLGFGSLGGCVVRETVVDDVPVVVREPPVERVEDPGDAPGTEYVWIRGHWVWNGDDWVWRRGHWEVRKAGYEWIPGHWLRRPHGWLWVEGHWHRA
jgi:hypothetical protein